MVVWAFGGSLDVLEYGWGAQAFLEACQSRELLKYRNACFSDCDPPGATPWYYLKLTAPMDRWQGRSDSKQVRSHWCGSISLYARTGMQSAYKEHEPMSHCIQSGLGTSERVLKGAQRLSCSSSFRVKVGRS